jgi:hypothetical protein
MWRIPAHRAGAQWSALQVEVAAIAAVGSTRSTRLRYEDFVADPIGTLTAATEALGVPIAATDLPSVTDGTVELGPSHGLSGNPSRFRSGATELRRDDRWVTEMPARDRAVVTALALPLLVAYGYPVGGTLRRTRATHLRRGVSRERR